MIPALLKMAIKRRLGQKKLDLQDLNSILSELRRRRLEEDKDVASGYPLRYIRGWLDEKNLRNLQEKNLRATMKYVYRYVPFYHRLFKEIGKHPDDIRRLSDMGILPVTRKTDLQGHESDFISRSEEYGIIAGEMTTSGTTGAPLHIYLTNYEIECHSSLGAIGRLISGQTGPRDIVQSHWSPGRPGVGWITEMSFRKAGALVIRYGLEGTLEQHAKTLFEDLNIPGKKRRVSRLVGSPSYLLALTKKIEELGLDFKDSGVENIATGGDFITDYFKTRIRETWGLTVSEGYSMTEMFPCGAYECQEHDSLHFTSILGYPEVLDTETLEPVAPGEEGNLVFTTFYPNRELMPLVRYATDDIVVMEKDLLCRCGQVSDRIKDIVGRLNYRVKIAAENVFPENIIEILSIFPDIFLPPRFTMRVVESERGQEIIIDVETTRSLSSTEKSRIETELGERLETLLEDIDSEQLRLGTIGGRMTLHPPSSLKDTIPVKMMRL